MNPAYYIVLGLTVASLGAIYIYLRHKHKPKEKAPYRIPDAEMESIKATAKYFKELGKTKSYTKAWQLLREHKEQLNEAVGEKLVNLGKKIKNDKR